MKISFYIHSRPLNDGTSRIMCVIRHGSKEKAFPVEWEGIKYSIIADDFIKSPAHLQKLRNARKAKASDRPKRVVSSNRRSKVINSILDQIENKAYSIIDELVLTGRPIDIDTLYKRLFSRSTESEFWQYMQEYLEARQSRVKYSSAHTYKAYPEKIRDFEKTGFSWSFSKIDIGSLNEFRDWIYANNRKNTANHVVVFLKGFLRDLDSRGIIRDRGYMQLKGGGERVPKYAIDFKTLDKLSAWEPKTGTDRQKETVKAYADLLVFLCWTGMRISEALDIRPSDIEGRVLTIRTVKGRKGEKQHTREVHLFDGALEAWKRSGHRWNITAKTASRKMPLFVRPILRELGVSERIIETVTTHTGRRSFATNMKECGLSDKEIQLLLGHKDVNTTHGYIKTQSSTARKKMQKLSDQIEASK